MFQACSGRVLPHRGGPCCAELYGIRRPNRPRQLCLVGCQMFLLFGLTAWTQSVLHARRAKFNAPAMQYCNSWQVLAGRLADKMAFRPALQVKTLDDIPSKPIVQVVFLNCWHLTVVLQLTPTNVQCWKCNRQQVPVSCLHMKGWALQATCYELTHARLSFAGSNFRPLVLQQCIQQQQNAVPQHAQANARCSQSCVHLPSSRLQQRQLPLSAHCWQSKYQQQGHSEFQQHHKRLMQQPYQEVQQRCYHQGQHIPGSKAQQGQAAAQQQQPQPKKQTPGASWTSLPNLLSLSRVASGPLVAWLIATQQWPLAVGLTAIAGVSQRLTSFAVVNPLSGRQCLCMLCCQLFGVCLLSGPRLLKSSRIASQK